MASFLFSVFISSNFCLNFWASPSSLAKLRTVGIADRASRATCVDFARDVCTFTASDYGDKDQRHHVGCANQKEYGHLGYLRGD